MFAVDFDGVLCDSAGEVAVSSWKALQALRPGLGSSSEPPPEAVLRFRGLRHLIETGHQAILLMCLIADGKEEVTGSALLESEAGAAREGWTRARLIELFGRTRDEWIARNPTDWLGRHRFYPGTVEAISARAATDAVFIVTTKQERFVEALLRSQRILLPARHIFGLNPLKSKEAVLEELSGRPEHGGARFHFIEDRLETLLRVSRRSGLEAVQLYLAAWGYNTEEERAAARAHPRIKVWNLPEFLTETEDV